MKGAENYIEINKQLWNEKTKHHVESDFYDMEGFLAGNTSLKTPELELLGDITDKEVVHLQCHFGQDTLSLARMGAKVTGVDLSDASIDYAKELAQKMELEARFIASDIYDVPNVLQNKFDVVFNTYGVLGWHPDAARWAKVAAGLLKEGGEMILVDFHPVVWMMNYEFTKFGYSYFNREPIVEMQEGTYADREADMEMKEVGWNHSLADILQGLIDAGLTIKVFKEYDWAAYDCFKNTVKIADGKWQIKGLEGILPMMYAIKAVKE